MILPEFISNNLRLYRYKIYRFKMRDAQEELARRKFNQKKTYKELAKDFSKKYSTIKNHNIENFTTPLWKKFNSRLEKALLPIPPFSFLQDPTIMYTMFATSGGKWLNKELKLLREKFDEDTLRLLLEEEYVGDPLLMDRSYLTSHTTIHHLYHLAKYLDSSKIKFDKIKTIMEWGGGYGNMIRILKKLESTEHTYIMVDTPLLCVLQWIYLSTVFGAGEVNLILSPKGKIKVGKINIVPIPFLDKVQIKADLFISTWAISESSKYSQDYVDNKDWFGAKRILLAFQSNPYGLYDPLRIGKLAKTKGARIIKIDFLPGNYYAFL